MSSYFQTTFFHKSNLRLIFGRFSFPSSWHLGETFWKAIRMFWFILDWPPGQVCRSHFSRKGPVDPGSGERPKRKGERLLPLLRASASERGRWANRLWQSKVLSNVKAHTSRYTFFSPRGEYCARRERREDGKGEREKTEFEILLLRITPFHKSRSTKVRVVPSLRCLQTMAFECVWPKGHFIFMFWQCELYDWKVSLASRLSCNSAVGFCRFLRVLMVWLLWNKTLEDWNFDRSFFKEYK